MIEQHHKLERKTGLLQEDAPGLCGSLKRSLGEETLPVFESAYALACQSGGLDESPILRPAGASYNPRPARICSIILRETQTEDTTALLCALLLGSQTRPLEVEGEGEITEALTLLQPIWDAILSPPLSSGLTPVQRNLAAAVHLDLLRHLHMTELPVQSQLDRIDNVCEYLLPELNSDENGRLQIMLQTIIRRAKQRLSSDS